MITIDASGAVVGRLCARISKLLLAKKEVEVVNADKAVMVGSLSAIKEKYLSRRSQKNKRKPENSPVWPRLPHLLLRRIVRGMLPYKSRRGREAYKRLRVLPPNSPYEGEKAQKMPEAAGEGKKPRFTLLELCQQLGKK